MDGCESAGLEFAGIMHEGSNLVPDDDFEGYHSGCNYMGGPGDCSHCDRDLERVLSRRECSSTDLPTGPKYKTHRDWRSRGKTKRMHDG